MIGNSRDIPLSIIARKLKRGGRLQSDLHPPSKGLAVLCLSLVAFSLVLPPSLAQTQSHPLSQILPIDTNLDLNNRNLTNSSYIGIGVTTPTNRLIVADGGSPYSGGTNRLFQLFSNTANSYLEMLLGNTENAFAIRYDSQGSRDQLQFVDGGSSVVMALANGGNVGIGTSSPVSAAGGGLHIVKNAGASVRVDSGTSGHIIELQSGSTQTYLGTNSNSDLGIFTANNTRMTIKSTGNIGIGTATPQAKLDVSGTINASSTITIGSPQSQYGLLRVGGGQIWLDRGQYVSLGDFGNVNNAYIGTDNTSSGWFVTLRAPTGYTSYGPWGGFRFVTGGDSGNDANAVVINPSGRLGIGSTSPSHTLNVVGDANITGFAHVGGLYGFNGSTGWLNVKSRDTSSPTFILEGWTGQTAALMLWKNAAGTGLGTIDSSGYLGINTTSPSLPLHLRTPESRIRLESTSGRSYDIVSGGGGALFASSFGIQDSTASGAPFRLVIDSSGNLGIGTTEPNVVGKLTGLAGTNLKVNSTSYQARLTVEGSVSGDLVLVDGNGRTNYRAIPFVVDYDSLNIGNLDETAGTTTSRLFINTSSARIGLGTISPSSALHVQLGTADFPSMPITDPTSTPGLVVEGSTADDSSTPSIVIASEANGATSNAQFIDLLTKDPSSANYDRWVLGRRGYASSSLNNRFMIGYTTSSNAHAAFNSPALTPTDANRAGIGTPTPYDALEVVAGGAEGVQIRSASRPTVFFNVTGGTMTQGWGIEVTNEGETAGDIGIREDTKSGSIRLVIQNNTGNVGIGTLNPSQKLTVAGDINITTGNKLYIGSRQMLTESGGAPILGDTAITLSVQTNLNPSSDSTYSLGLSTTNVWQALFVKNITATGYVAINKTTASTALDVSGTITGTTKNFEIDHPTKEGYRLVHSTLEGPEVGVYYRGIGRLVNGSASVNLPEYFDELTRDNTTTILLTAKGSLPFTLSYDSFDEKSFVVHGSISEGYFDWQAEATRADVAPLVVEKPS